VQQRVFRFRRRPGASFGQAQNLVAARSAARLGHSDFGVNRKRVENLRVLLAKQSVIR
jgi:uncharacterized protein (DUF1499 family)